MSMLSRVREWFEARASLENPSVPLSLAAFLGWLGAGEPTASGEIINVASAMQITTVYRCVRLIAESVASLPLVIYTINESGGRTRVDHDLTWILACEPNDEMSAAAFWEAFVGNMAAAGNAYAEVIRDRGGAVRGLYPLSAATTNPRRNMRTGELEYVTSAGMGDGRERVIPKEDMIHCPLFGFDGLKGFNPITLARQMLGLAKATERFGSKFFGNGAFPSGILAPEAGTVVTDKQRGDIKESWERNYGGDNQRRVAVLTAAWKWQAIGISPEDSQFLGTQQFTRTQIAGLFGVAPHKVGDTSRLSNNNHEQESLSFVTDTLRPYLNRIEQELERKLVPRSGPNAYNYQIEFDVSERLRGDFATTQAGMALGRQWGWLSANDVRRQLGLNPIGEEGDIYLSPLNMIDAKKAADAAPEPVPAPDAPAAPGAAEADSEEGRMLGHYAAAHAGAFVRAFRLANGDTEGLRSGLEPVVAGLADTAAREHPFIFWPDETQKRIAAEALDGVVRRVKRAAVGAGGRFTLSEQFCREEFRRLVRSIHIHTARESAAIQAEYEVQGELL